MTFERQHSSFENFDKIVRRILDDLLKKDGDLLLRWTNKKERVVSVRVANGLQHFKICNNAKPSRIGPKLQFPSTGALLQYFHETGEPLQEETVLSKLVDNIWSARKMETDGASETLAKVDKIRELIDELVMGATVEKRKAAMVVHKFLDDLRNEIELAETSREESELSWSPKSVSMWLKADSDPTVSGSTSGSHYSTVSASTSKAVHTESSVHGTPCHSELADNSERSEVEPLRSTETSFVRKFINAFKRFTS